MLMNSLLENNNLEIVTALKTGLCEYMVEVVLPPVSLRLYKISIVPVMQFVIQLIWVTLMRHSIIFFSVV